MFQFFLHLSTSIALLVLMLCEKYYHNFLKLNDKSVNEIFKLRLQTVILRQVFSKGDCSRNMQRNPRYKKFSPTRTIYLIQISLYLVHVSYLIQPSVGYNVNVAGSVRTYTLQRRQNRTHRV